MSYDFVVLAFISYELNFVISHLLLWFHVHSLGVGSRGHFLRSKRSRNEGRCFCWETISFITMLTLNQIIHFDLVISCQWWSLLYIINVCERLSNSGMKSLLVVSYLWHFENSIRHFKIQMWTGYASFNWHSLLVWALHLWGFLCLN